MCCMNFAKIERISKIVVIGTISCTVGVSIYGRHSLPEPSVRITQVDHLQNELKTLQVYEKQLEKYAEILVNFALGSGKGIKTGQTVTVMGSESRVGKSAVQSLPN